MNRRIITLTLNEGDLALVRHIEEATILNNADGQGYSPELVGCPLSREEARSLLDPDDRVTVVVEVAVEDFTQSFASSGGRDVYDLLHEAAFGDLGITTDSAYEILGLTSNSSAFIVRYSTQLSDCFTSDDDESNLHQETAPSPR